MKKSKPVKRFCVRSVNKLYCSPSFETRKKAETHLYALGILYSTTEMPLSELATKERDTKFETKPRIVILDALAKLGWRVVRVTVTED